MDSLFLFQNCCVSSKPLSCVKKSVLESHENLHLGSKWPLSTSATSNVRIIIIIFRKYTKIQFWQILQKKRVGENKVFKWPENLRNVIDSDFWWILMVFEADQSSLSWFRIEKKLWLEIDFENWCSNRTFQVQNMT